MTERRSLFPRPEGPTDLSPARYALAHYVMRGSAKIDTSRAFPQFSKDQRRELEETLKTLSSLTVVVDAQHIPEARKTTLGSNFQMFKNNLVPQLLTDILVGRLVADDSNLSDSFASVRCAKGLIYDDLSKLTDEGRRNRGNAFAQIKGLTADDIMQGILDGVIALPAFEEARPSLPFPDTLLDLL